MNFCTGYKILYCLAQWSQLTMLQICNLKPGAIIVLHRSDASNDAYVLTENAR